VTEVPGSPSRWSGLLSQPRVILNHGPARAAGQANLVTSPRHRPRCPLLPSPTPEAGPRVLIEAHPVIASAATWGGRRSARLTAGRPDGAPVVLVRCVTPPTVEIAAGRISARASRCSPYRSLGFCSLFVLDLLHPQGTACRYANASFPPASSVEPRAASQLRRRRGLPQR